MRLWDAQWEQSITIRDYLALETVKKFNDFGEATLVLDPKSSVAQWVMQTMDGKKNRTVFMTVDKNGVRWSGRAREYKISLKDSTLTVFFDDDMITLKHILQWSNPFLGASLQFPKFWTMFAPLDWAIKVTMFANMFRISGNLWNIPDDPLDPATWVEGITPWNWPNCVVPGSLLLSGAPWVVISSRFEPISDLLDICTEHGYMVTYRRWLEGDPMPYPGCLVARNGQCFWDVVDKGSALGETVLGGNIFTGLIRTVQTYAENTLDTVIDTVANPVARDQYSERGMFLFTRKKAPFVIYRAKYGLQAMEYSRQAAGAIQQVTGGDSAPGVNEMIGLPIRFVGNVIGAIIPGFDTFGDLADSLLKEIYSDVFLAFAAIKSPIRARQAGWNPLEEDFISAPGKAYTTSMWLALARGFYQTRETDSHKIDIGDGAPYVVGERGGGHFSLGDRIGAEVPYSNGRVVVNQVTELKLVHKPGEAPSWVPTLGDMRLQEMPLDRALKSIGKLYKAIRNLGVF
ncbi:MAG: hypothetical protein WAN89_02725 [Lawsonella sp.]